MNIVLLLAGGVGSRMGQDIPKQFIHVNNRPVIIYTLSALQAHPEIDRIIVPCIDGWEKVLAGYAEQFGITKLTDIVPGGGTRYDSTRRAMETVWDAADDDVIVVHDGVRPLVTPESLSDTIRGCHAEGNSMTSLDCADTMYARTTAGYTSAVVERANLVRGQTPEAVTGQRMREMYAAADEKGIHLDSISAMQTALGWDIPFAKGSERNIKLTRVEDIDLFQAILATERDAWLK